MRQYINEAADGNTTTTTHTMEANSEVLFIGGRAAATQTWLGFMDEVRVSNVDRSAGWIETRIAPPPRCARSGAGSAVTAGAAGI